jgi:hypothetical protein
MDWGLVGAQRARGGRRLAHLTDPACAERETGLHGQRDLVEFELATCDAHAPDYHRSRTVIDRQRMRTVADRMARPRCDRRHSGASVTHVAGVAGGRFAVTRASLAPATPWRQSASSNRPSGIARPITCWPASLGCR